MISFMKVEMLEEESTSALFTCEGRRRSVYTAKPAPEVLIVVFEYVGSPSILRTSHEVSYEQINWLWARNGT
jgi:hypothetical protein